MNIFFYARINAKGNQKDSGANIKIAQDIYL